MDTYEYSNYSFQMSQNDTANCKTSQHNQFSSSDYYCHQSMLHNDVATQLSDAETAR